MNKKKIIVFALIAAALGSLYVWKKKSAGKLKENLRPVAVQKGSISVSVSATGVVQPQNRLEIKPAIAGRIEEMLVEEGARVKKGQILAWLSSSERAALLDAARAQGEKELKKWEQIYKPAPLVAPMNGIIIARSAEPGQTVTTSDIPLVMSDRLIVKAQVDETDIGQLKPAQKSEITLDAYPKEKIPGKIHSIAFEAKTVNNVTIYEADVVPQAVPDFMRSGMTANITFQIQKKDDVLIVPQTAVRKGEEGSYVFVPVPEGQGKPKRRTRTVKTGISDGKNVEVTDGLSEGETILAADMKWEGAQKSQGSSPFSPMGRRPQQRGGVR